MVLFVEQRAVAIAGWMEVRTVRTVELARPAAAGFLIECYAVDVYHDEVFEGIDGFKGKVGAGTRRPGYSGD